MAGATGDGATGPRGLGGASAGSERVLGGVREPARRPAALPLGRVPASTTDAFQNVPGRVSRESPKQEATQIPTSGRVGEATWCPHTIGCDTPRGGRVADVFCRLTRPDATRCVRRDPPWDSSKPSRPRDGTHTVGPAG